MSWIGGAISIIAVGKLREPHWRAAQTSYLKRLRRYTKVAIIETKDIAGRSLPDVVALQREGEQLIKAAENADHKVLLNLTGRQMNSEQFAAYLQQQFVRHGHLAFIVGGPFGVSDEVVAGVNEQLSLSLLTFPHEVARVILLEQLYRGCTILNNEKYHK
jgi:23S rRNA (pseudouridine1915-N3)-methyltransferase